MLYAKLFFIGFLLKNDWVVGAAQSAGPLILTPYIQSGDIKTARDLAAVTLEGATSIVSYAGYLTLDKAHDSNSYFWFFPAQQNSTTAPVLLWLQGGPGVSTMYGVLLEHGPFRLTSNLTLELREHTWAKSHNVIYLENPIGTGFSFTQSTDGYRTNETAIAEDVVAALKQFFQLFPEYVTNDFFIAGESYGGKYGPAVSIAIDDYNARNKIPINLQGLMIFAGLSDPINQMIYGDFYYQMGLIDSNGRDAFHLREREVRQLLREKNFFEARKLFDAMIFTRSGNTSLFQALTGYKYLYNLLQTAIPSEVFDMVKWVQSDNTRSALHVGNTSFAIVNPDVFNNLQYDYMQSAATQIAHLLSVHRVIFLHGNLDLVIPYPGIENVLANLEWHGSAEYRIAERKILWIDQELAGYVKNVHNLTEVLVRDAGHPIPADQPKWTLNIIRNFTRNLSL